MTWTDHIEGDWLADDLRRAFVMGAKWWEFHSTGGTMWPSDRWLAEEQAEKMYPGGKLPPGDNLADEESIERIKDESRSFKSDSTQ